MKNKQRQFLIALCVTTIMGVAACSEDSTVSSSMGGSEKETKACGNETDGCTGDRVCVDDRCVLHVSLGESCSEKDVVCAEGSCIDGICKTANACGSELKGCKDGRVCENNLCMLKVGLGEECTGENVVCTEGTCQNGVCAVEQQPEEPLPTLGEKCTSARGCADGAVCSFNTCVLEDLSNGAECDDLIRFCAPDWTCENAQCIKYAYTGDSCGEYELCSETDVCFDGVCLEKKECLTDNDCQNDSYCCTEDACSVKNVCISYGSGPRGTTDETCEYQTVPGMFEAAIQCEWKGPSATDPHTNSAHVLTTPLVMDTPHDSGQANEIIFVTYNHADGGSDSGTGTSINYYGVIRIINAETCALHETIFDDNNHIIGGSNPLAADVDNDGKVEIFASRGYAQKSGSGGGVVAFHWVDADPTAEPGTEAAKGHYAWWWTTDIASTSTLNWGGAAVHDINDDGIPEIIGYGGEVFNATNGKRMNVGQTIGELYYTPTLGDLDNDGKVEIIGTVNTYRWNSELNKWETAYTKKASTGLHPAFADFGTRNEDGTFDTEHLDGRAEIVNCGSGVVQISTLEGESVLRVTGLAGGGPCTVGDFDGDNLPEVATAFGDSYRIFDPRCKSAADGCAKPYILWEKTSQDASSSSTGSSLFDFDGDGAMEAVYADECYTRVYDGKTGDVLFSAYRSSWTWHEYPVIADVDNDESAEIIVGSNNAIGCKTPDPIHRGLRCEKNADCKSLNCVDGLCRCTTNDQCNSRTDMSGNILNEYACVAGLTAADQAGGSVCRARRDASEQVTGIRVMRDSLDRWTSSRNIWNQHAYSVTNVNDNMTVPKTSEWVQNFMSVDPVYNNFRQNTQGKRGRNVAPDITGRFTTENACSQSSGGTVTLGAEICNRGTKMVASLMPASFYLMGNDGSKTHLCTSYTSENVPIGGCLRVTCDVPDAQNFIGQQILMIANDDGKGGRTTVECNDKNNEDYTVISTCPIL